MDYNSADMLQRILAAAAFPWLRAFFVVVLLSVAFVWWRRSKQRGDAAAGGADLKGAAAAAAEPEEGGGRRARQGMNGAAALLIGDLSAQLKMVAEDVERARRTQGRSGQKMYLYGARQRMKTIVAAAGGSEEMILRINVQANLSLQKLADYVDRALLLIDRESK